MAYIPRIIEKGICPICFGSGWNPDIHPKDVPLRNIKKEKPSSFDLDKCAACNGTGIKLEYL